MKKSLFYFAICVLLYACSDFNDIENVKEETQEGNDKLGSFEMYFGDNVINDETFRSFYPEDPYSYNKGRSTPLVYRFANYRKYNLGNCYLVIAPRVYK